MSSLWFFFRLYLSAAVRLVFLCFRKKAVILGVPVHTNLGDQAQYLCTLRWLERHLPEYRLISLPPMAVFPGFYSHHVTAIRTAIDAGLYLLIRFCCGKRDLFVGHSGYFFVDHHPGWPTYARVLQDNPQVPFLILPQTVNFYAPVFRDFAARVFSDRTNLLFLARDETSFRNARELFRSTRVLLYPDIVTTMIGSRVRAERGKEERHGILFCLRTDIEKFYSDAEIEELKNELADFPSETLDTTISISRWKMAKARESLIDEMIAKFAAARLVITDRYHGTIFSQIAATPVIVLDSNDHKLRSGVDWFSKAGFGECVQFAGSLSDAARMARSALGKPLAEPPSGEFFHQQFWNPLGEIVRRELKLANALMEN